jgi:hypothetical protein
MTKDKYKGLAMLVAVLCSSCVAFKGTKHTYMQGAPVEVAGAEVAMGFRPEGTRSGSVMVTAMVVGGGMATFDGPFRWRVEAVGREGKHELLVVHRIRTKTEKTGRDEWFPESELGRSAEFRKHPERPGMTRARYDIPGLLKVEPEKDGRLDVWVDLSLNVEGKWQRRTIRFKLDPGVKSQNEFIFLPVEVARNIGKPLADQEDSMWD